MPDTCDQALGQWQHASALMHENQSAKTPLQRAPSMPTVHIPVEVTQTGHEQEYGQYLDMQLSADGSCSAWLQQLLLFLVLLYIVKRPHPASCMGSGLQSTNGCQLNCLQDCFQHSFCCHHMMLLLTSECKYCCWKPL